jgi:hypothetical protein
MHIPMTGSCASPSKHHPHPDEDQYGMQYCKYKFPCILCIQLVCTPAQMGIKGLQGQPQVACLFDAQLYK